MVTGLHGNVNFGGLTSSVPRGMRTVNDPGLTMINQLNSTFTAQGPEGGGGAPPKMTADVANDFAAIRAGQDGAGKPSFMQNPIKFIANMFVDNKIANAAGGKG